jgi:hypothetical protein
MQEEKLPAKRIVGRAKRRVDTTKPTQPKRTGTTRRQTSGTTKPKRIARNPDPAPAPRAQQVMNPFAGNPEESTPQQNTTETTAQFTKTRYEHYQPKQIVVRDDKLKFEKKKSPQEIEREQAKEKERLRKQMLIRA